VLADVPIADLTDPVQAALAPLTGPLADATGIDVDTTVDTVEDLLIQLLTTRVLDVSLGKATSSVLTTASSLTSTGTAEGATIKLLPISTPLGEIPLVTIKIGSSQATASYDRQSAKAVPSFSAALVTIDLAPALGLPAALSHIEVAPGQTIDIPGLKGTPLESTIRIADGHTETLADGGVKAIADGVSLELLKGIGASSPTAMDGGVVLQLAHSEAEVAGAPAVKSAEVLAQTSLPRTGGTPWIPMAGIGILAIALVGRRAMNPRTVRD
jgi:hypothetical protein